MASLKKVHEMLCLCLIEEIIDEEEFVLLYEAYRPSNLPLPHSANAKFSLMNKDPAEGKADFRVEKRDIPLLFDVFYYATSKEYLLSSNAAMESRLGSSST